MKYEVVWYLFLVDYGKFRMNIVNLRITTKKVITKGTAKKPIEAIKWNNKKTQLTKEGRRWTEEQNAQMEGGKS